MHDWINADMEFLEQQQRARGLSYHSRIDEENPLDKVVIDNKFSNASKLHVRNTKTDLTGATTPDSHR